MKYVLEDVPDIDTLTDYENKYPDISTEEQSDKFQPEWYKALLRNGLKYVGTSTITCIYRVIDNVLVSFHRDQMHACNIKSKYGNYSLSRINDDNLMVIDDITDPGSTRSRSPFCRDIKIDIYSPTMNHLYTITFVGTADVYAEGVKLNTVYSAHRFIRFGSQPHPLPYKVGGVQSKRAPDLFNEVSH
jgi:hypothetical protein